MEVFDSDFRELMKYKPAEIVDWVRDILIAEGYFNRRTKDGYEKPRHGNCCTCQTCGKAHEDCICEDIEYNELFDTMMKEADMFFD